MYCKVEHTEIPLNESSNSWNGGPNNTLLSKDGFSTNKKKYEEKMGQGEFTYILQIHNFSELDVDCIYSCTFGVDSASKKFDLNEEDYQYVPTEMMHVSSEVRNNNFKVDIRCNRVWPTPICDVSFQGIHYANKTSTSKTLNGKLYSVFITLRQRLSTHSCSSKMIISCQIGTEHIVFPSKMLDRCTVTDDNQAKTGSYARVIALLIAIIGIGLIPFVVYIVVAQKRKNSIPVQIIYTEIRRTENGCNGNSDSENPDDPVGCNSNSDQLSSNVNQT
ncbi:Hypothetical predicted protein [Mytilus galloprovincialis]|nr:Hypothetical predicted protein [Mytilus galloprovincialis]